MASYQPGLVLRVTKVHWDDGLAFLYSGPEGMFASDDGETWTAAGAEGNSGTSVPATSLAWIDDVWVACDDNGGQSWRSTDGGETWVSMGFDFRQVGGCQPPPVGDEEQPGIFGAYREDGDNGLVYLSTDKGASWSVAHTIPMTIPFGAGDGFESIKALSGCGNGIFVGTIRGESAFANGDAMVYASINGAGFSSQKVWTGTNDVPTGEEWVPDPHTLGYRGGAVGYDKESGTYAFVGLKEEKTDASPAPTDVATSVIYATGSGGSFSGESELATATRTSAPATPLIGEGVSDSGFASGGDGKFITAGRRDNFTASGGDPPTPADFELYRFGSGSGTQVLLSVDDIFASSSFFSQMCWKEGDNDAPGTFACVVIGGSNSRVFVAKDGSNTFLQKHSSGGDFGAIAVGKVSWL